VRARCRRIAAVLAAPFLVLTSGCMSLQEDPKANRVTVSEDIRGKKSLHIRSVSPTEPRYRSAAFEHTLVESLRTAGVFRDVTCGPQANDTADMEVEFTYHGEYETNLVQNFWFTLFPPMSIIDGVSVTSSLVLNGKVHEGDTRTRVCSHQAHIECKDRNPLFLLNIPYFLVHAAGLMGRRQHTGRFIHTQYGRNLATRFAESALSSDGGPPPPPPPPRVQRRVWQPGGNRRIWLLVIAVGRFAEPEVKVPRLPYAVRDADRIQRRLVELGQGALKREQIKVLLDSDAAGQSEVLAGFRWLKERAAPDDLAVVYFAGHGAPELAADGSGYEAAYLMLHKTRPDALYSTGLRLDDVATRLDDIRARTQLVILECCHAGEVGKAIMKQSPTANLEIRPRVYRQMGTRRGRIVLAACGGRQVAMQPKELTQDRGQPPMKIEGGLFTHFLLDALNRDGQQTLTQCFTKVKDTVTRAALRLGTEQIPQAYGDEHVDIIFSPGTE